MRAPGRCSARTLEASHSPTRLIVGSAPDGVADAPYTGADVRADPFLATPGASFGGLLFVGATRPA